MLFGYPDTPTQSPFRSAVRIGDTGTPPVASHGGGAASLQQDLTLARLRLVYYEELLANRGVDTDLAHEAATARAGHLDTAAALSETRHELAQQHAVSAELRERVAALESEVEHHPSMADACSLRQQLRDAQERVAELESELLRVKDTLQRCRDDSSAALRTCDLRTDDARRMLEAQLEARDATIAQLESEVALARDAVAAADAKVASFDAKALHAQVDAEHARSRSSELSQELAQLEARNQGDLAQLRLRTAAFELLLAAARDPARFDGGRRRVEITDVESPTPALVALHSDLEDAITDCCAAVASHTAKAGTTALNELRRAGNDAMLALESSFGSVAAHVRRTTNRVMEAEVAVTDCAARVRRRRRATTSALAELAQERAASAALQAELARASQERAASDAAAKLGGMAADVERAVQRIANDAAANIRGIVSGSNAITRDFVANIDAVVRKTASVVHLIHDIIDANRGPSAGSRSPSPAGREAPPTQHTVEQLVKQCSNIAALLTNSVQQAEEIERRVAILVSSFQSAVADRLASFERTVVRSMRASIDESIAPTPMHMATPGRTSPSGRSVHAL